MPRRPITLLALALAALALAACTQIEMPVPVTAFVPPTFTAAPPTLTPPASVTAPPAPPTVIATPSATMPAPTTTPTKLGQALTPVTYSVIEGDVFITIAARFNLTAEQLLDANPGVDPALLHPGDVLIIPDPATLTPADARVKLNGGGLRVRAWPDLAAEVVVTLPALTRVALGARSADNDWAQVTTLTGVGGWVPVLWLDLGRPFADLPVATAAAPPPTPTELGQAATPLPYTHFTSNVTLRMLGVFQYGQVLGNRANVFSKIGDSITISTAFLVPVGLGNYNLGPYTALQPVIDFFSAAEARAGQNAFANRSLAAKVGWRARAVFGTRGDPQPGCAAGERPLACEYRVVRPAVAVIMLGTNDVPYTPDAEFDRDLRQILDYTLSQGIIPILSTIPPFTRPGNEGRAEALNVILRNLAFEYALPLIDYYAAMAPLPNAGLAGDGVHPSAAYDGRNADFTADNLQDGLPMRNLTALYALYEVWDKVMRP